MAGKFLDDLVFKVIADTKGAVEGLTKVGDKAQDLNKHAKSSASGMEAMFGKIKVGAAIAAAAVTAVGIGIGKLALDAATAAAKAEEENRKLALTLKNVTGATEESATAVTQWISEVSLAYGIVGGELSAALDQLARATRDVTKSQEILGLAMDVSAGTGVDLRSVATALGEAYKGNYTQLTRLRTGISETALESKNFKTISAELAQLFEGQADEAANSFQGQLSRMRLAFQNLQENLGTMVLPVFKLIVNISNKALVPAIRNWITNAQKHPEMVDKLVKASARVINVFKDVASITFSLTGAFLLALSALVRLVQGLGWLIEITGGEAGKGIKDWGRETAEALIDMANSLDKAALALSKFDANKYISGFDFSKVKLPPLLPDVGDGITGGKAAKDKDKEVAKLASDFNDAAKAILDAVRTISRAFDAILATDLRKLIANLSLDPLVVSMNEMIDATKDYAKAQDDLVAKTRESAKADLEYVKSMTDITEKGKERTRALREQVDRARESAIQSAQDTNTALQRIADAQKAFVDETISRVKAVRDAFKQATTISIGGIAGSIAASKENIENAKKKVADAEKSLLEAQEKFKRNVAVQAYAGVIQDLVMPVFEEEKKAVDKAKEELAIALGEKKNPYAATAEELLKALRKAYDEAVELSKVSGDLAALGFSQDFIVQLLEAGPEIALELGKTILAADPLTQRAMVEVFDGIQEVSKNGVNQLSIDLNMGAIKAMESFIKGFATVKTPLDMLMKAIEDRVNAMITTIEDAIKAIMAQLAALAKIPLTPIPKVDLPPNWEKSQIPPKDAQDAANAAIAAAAAAAEAAALAAEAEAAAAAAEADLLASRAESEHFWSVFGTPAFTSVPPLAERGAAVDPYSWQDYYADRFRSSGAGMDEGAHLRNRGIIVTVNATTNADPNKIAAEVGFAIKTGSDVTYSYSPVGGGGGKPSHQML